MQTQKNKITGTPERLIDITAEEYELTYTQLTGKSRYREYITARYTAMYLIRNYFKDFTLLKIGSLFSYRDHSSIHHALKVYNEWDELDMIDYNKVSNIIAKFEDESYAENPVTFSKSYKFLNLLG